MSYVLRSYQEQAHRSCLEELYAGRRTLLVLPTGTGKTIVFARVVRDWIEARGTSAIVLAHRRELIHQAVDKLVGAGGLDGFDIGIEMGQERARDLDRVVVGSVQTLRGSRLEQLRPERFGLLVVDEAHHAVAASYAGILRHLGFDIPRNGELSALNRRVRDGDAGLLGVTATPDRLDGRALGRWFDSSAFTYEIADAIDDGWIVRIRPRMIFSEGLDLSRVRTTAGDLDKAELAAVMEEDANLDLVARATFDESGDRPTLVFAASIAQARSIAGRLCELRPGCADAMDGTASHAARDDVLDRHAAGRFQFLVNVLLYTEGVDLPHVSCVVIARPTKSRGLYAQMIGRGTRLLGPTREASIAAGKQDLRILDFCGASGRHKLVCAIDVLDGNTDGEVRKRAMVRLQAEEGDLQQVLDEVAHEIVQESRLQAMRSVKYRTVAAADPFTILGVRPRSGRFGGRPASEAQRAVLERHKIPGFRRLDFGQASQLIDAIQRRRRRGLASVRQTATLIRWGLKPDVDGRTASWAIGRIAATGWRTVPPEVRKKLRSTAPEPDVELGGELSGSDGPPPPDWRF